MVKNIILFFILASFSLLVEASCVERWDVLLGEESIPNKYQSLMYVCDNNLKSKIFHIIKTNKELTYYEARFQFFSFIDNEDGFVRLAYSNRLIETDGIPDPKIVNCEHSWPQSMGATGIAKSDIHHLFPVLADINTMRSNLPFCEVGYILSKKYESKKGYSKKSNTKCFEPPNSHKGALARSMFYFSVRYNRPIDPEQEYWFRKWNKEYRVSQKEIKRNNAIERVQGNRNIFIDASILPDLISDF